MACLKTVKNNTHFLLWYKSFLISPLPTKVVVRFRSLEFGIQDSLDPSDER